MKLPPLPLDGVFVPPKPKGIFDDDEEDEDDHETIIPASASACFPSPPREEGADSLHSSRLFPGMI